jgi:hypothetical protein
MDKIFKVAELISTDIRSRANVNIIRSAIDGINENIILDFTDVAFMSRSFTDELYNLMNEHKNVSLSNMNDFVGSMYNAVVEGRKSKRVFESESSEIKECDDMKSLASFLSTI